MKKITLTLNDVDVSIVKFVDHDAYGDFPQLDCRKVENIDSPVDEIEKISMSKPVALVKQADNSYLVISKKKVLPIF